MSVEWELKVWSARERREVSEERVVEREEGELGLGFGGKLGVGFKVGK